MDLREILPANTLLDGSYLITRVVGTGGFGITYEAQDINLGTAVAIKEYYPIDFAERDSDDEHPTQVGSASTHIRLGPNKLPAGGPHTRPVRTLEHRARDTRVRGQLDRLHGDAL